MAVGNIHELGPIVFNDGTSDTLLTGIDNVTADPGVEHFLEAAGGQADPSFIAVNSHDPQITFSASDVSTALGLIGIDGLEVSSTATQNTVDAYFTQVDKFATRLSGSNHYRLRCNLAHVIPRRLAAQQGEKAGLDVEIHALYDGTNNPFVPSDSIALPSTPTVDELFTVGPGSINGTNLDGITGIDLDFGITLDKVMVEGEAFPRTSYIQTRQPKLTITTLDTVSLNTFGFSGTAQGGTASTFYFTKVDEQGTRVADGTAEHIKVTVNTNQGMINVTQNTGSVGGRAESTITITPVVGGSAIIGVSNASAIT